MVISVPTGTGKVNNLQRLSVCCGKFPYHSHFSELDPKLWLKRKPHVWYLWLYSSTHMVKSAFLLNRKTGRSGGATNGTVLPTENVSEIKGITSLNHLPHHTHVPCFISQNCQWKEPCHLIPQPNWERSRIPFCSIWHKILTGFSSIQMESAPSVRLQCWEVRMRALATVPPLILTLTPRAGVTLIINTF